MKSNNENKNIADIFMTFELEC